MNWGTWIVLSFVAFAIFIGILVSVCMRQDISLVSKNYYEEELRYEDQVKRIRNTAALSEKPIVSIANHSLQIRFAGDENPTACIVDFFRPSDHKLDRQFKLSSWTDHVSSLNVDKMPKGLYHLKIHWTDGHRDYFLEQRITL